MDERLNRADIRSDPGDGLVPDGTPLNVAFKVSRVSGAGCAPLAGAFVDLWQCDALGVYSGVTDANGLFETRGKKFLRGYQVSDAAGRVEFRTIYPGWYQGRTVHIHVKVHVRGNVVHTGQLYFSDRVTDAAYRKAPYTNRPNRDVRNADDIVFRNGGKRSLLSVRRNDERHAGRQPCATPTMPRSGES